LIAELPPGRIDLIKMDIEGAEVEILETLPREILRRIGQITAEFHSAPIFGFDLQLRVERIIRRLRRERFMALDFSRGSRTDVLFVNRRMYGISWLASIRQEFKVSSLEFNAVDGKSLPSGIGIVQQNTTPIAVDKSHEMSTRGRVGQRFEI